MRYSNTSKQFSMLLLGSILCSLMLLLGACAEMTTPTSPALNGNAQAAAAATAPAPTSITFTAPPATPTQVPPTATAAATATTAPTTTAATAAPTATTAVPTATPVPPTATQVPPTATKAPPTKAVPTTSLAGSKGDNSDLAFVAVNGNVPGKDASVTIQTMPSRECSISYVTPNGQASTAKGLEKKVSDLDGRLTWKWTIGTGTKVGKGTVKVTCGDASESRQITIG